MKKTSNPYDAGRLFKIKITKTAELDGLMYAAA